MEIKRKNIIEQNIDVVLNKKQLEKSKSSNGLWISKVRKYGKCLGMICYITIHKQIKNSIVNIYPIGEEASNVIIKTHFLNVIDDKILTYIDAWHMYNFINGLKPKKWKDGLEFKIDMWIRL